MIFMQNLIVQSDALTYLKTLPDDSVNCIITSPPYYNLRDYGVDGQIGLEKTPKEYIDRLTEVFREAYRILKPDGTLWVNIADSYCGSGKARNGTGEINKSVFGAKQGTNRGSVNGILSKTVGDCKPKDLIGIPWMLAFALRDEVGFYLRQDIIWEKGNCMPESVTDRCTKSHEYLFLFSKSRKYYFDYEAIKEPALTRDTDSPRGSKGTKTKNAGRRNKDQLSLFNAFDKNTNEVLMRRKRDVWHVNTSGYKDAHFATFPPSLVEPCVLAGCPKDGVVLDMFAGSGTVGEVCKNLDRHYILIDLNPQYVNLMKKRLGEESEGIAA